MRTRWFVIAALSLAACKNPTSEHVVMHASFAHVTAGDVLEMTVATVFAGHNNSPLIDYRLVTLELRHGARGLDVNVGSGPLSDTPVALSAGGDAIAIMGAHRGDVLDATTGAPLHPIDAPPAELLRHYDAVRAGVRTQESVALAEGRELALRGHDGEEKLAVAKNGILEASADTAFWKAGFLTDEAGALSVGDPPAYFVKSQDGLGTGPHFMVARVSTDAKVTWLTHDSTDDLRAPLLAARVVGGDELVLVFGTPANEAVAYDARDGHVRWRTTF